MKLFKTLLLALGVMTASAQNLPTVAVLDFDTRGYQSVAVDQLIQQAIVDLIRINQHEVVDKYDIEYISKRDNVDLTGCFSKICLADIGKRLDCDYILTGSFDQLGMKVSVTIRLYSVSEHRFVKSASTLFLDIPEQALTMTQIVINDLCNVENDAEMVKKLTISEEYENMLNNPDSQELDNTGPRLGYTFVTGKSSKILMDNSYNGGFDYWSPSMFSFGFQFEKVFLNSGNFQALVEGIPMIAGIEYGRFIPSATILMGMRNSATGWEFAIGPNFTSTTLGNGYYDAGGVWHSEFDPSYDPTGFNVEKRLDSRGDLALNSGLLIGVGKTFKSGRMNYPVNVFVVPPAKGNSWRFGFSTGFNIITKKKPTL